MSDNATPQFPIDAIQTTFREQVKQRHIIIEAETGTGKSTRLPVWAAELGRVLVIEPRRVACTSLAEYVAELEGADLGGRIGYAIKFEAKFSDTTEIVFATPGVALRWFSENRLSEFDIVMLDEFHERRADMDILAGLLLATGKHRLIVTSATINTAVLADYFDAEVLRAEGKRFDVSECYLVSNSSQIPSWRHLESRVKEAVERCLDGKGDILIFLPGRKEIQQCQSALSAIDADIIPLHASVSERERHNALTESDRKRIILATNIAETSLTIPGITAVIDSGLERRTHSRHGRSVLALHAISKASAKQRKGRAGRVAPGRCLRLYGEFAPLEAFTPPELEREELVDMMLASACCGFELTALSLLSSLPQKNLELARQQLIQMDALDCKGKVTAHGKILYPLPIDSLFAHLISAMKSKANREAMVDLAAVLQTPQTLWTLSGNELAYDQYKDWNPKLCDAVTSIRVLRGERPECLVVNEQTLEEAVKTSESMRSALSLPGLLAPSRFDRNSWLNDVMAASPELVFVRREKRRQAFGNGLAEVQLSRGSVFPEKDEAAIVFDQFHLSDAGGRNPRSIASCMAPVSFAQLEMQGVGEWVTEEVVKSEAGVAIAQMKLMYVGRVIAVKEAEANGKALITSMAERLLAGELLPGTGEKVCEQIRYWNLFNLIQNNDEVPVDIALWVEKRLELLGVESEEDLELVDESDFEFDGIPEWELPKFKQAHPLTVTLADLFLDVEYQPKRKRVVLHHIKGKRKQDPQRWELPRWNGWKVQYKKASRTIDIK